ncbi:MULTISPECIES: alpha/beta hydrolase [unclassified Rhizobium]|uniref:alpha/beta fold hydrolase n=1 Tax=unclassified Rhizobium TaxID=2613769 RepID=UPI001FCDD8C5|nr:MULTISPECIES: alpha/beta hydrolase [unclassified Rhizobium]
MPMTTFATAETKDADVNGTKFVYRTLGPKDGVPVLFLHHLTGVMDDWDPRLIDGIAASHPVILFDNRGLGGTDGIAPATVDEMAVDAVAFVNALGIEKVDLFGFSLGGFVAQAFVQREPGLVRKIILAGTGPTGGEGISGVGALIQNAFQQAGATGKHPKHFLFFTETAEGQAAGDEFLSRLEERTENRDAPARDETIGAQIAAIDNWGGSEATDLSNVEHPVFVANGDKDIMVPTVNSFELAKRLPNARLSIFPSTGHGGIFQHHKLFVQQALEFLR